MKKENFRPPLLIVISGPSGVGKDSILKKMKDNSLPFYFVVTATTRPARPSEVNGKDYFFLSTNEFKTMIDQNEFLEYSTVYNQYKGVPKRQIYDALLSGKDVIMRVDVQGVEKLKSLEPNLISIFILPEDEKALVSRLVERKTETDKEISVRIEAAYQELEKRNQFDYCVVNRNMALDDTVEEIVNIILKERENNSNVRKINLDNFR